MESNVCPVCGSQATISTYKDCVVISCIKCKKFLISDDLIELRTNLIESKLRACMYFYLTQNIIDYKTKDGSSQKIMPYFKMETNPEMKIKDKHYFISQDSLYNIFPNSFSDLINKIMLNLAYLSNGIGNEVSINIGDYILLKNIFFIDNENEIYLIRNKYNNILEMLEERDFIKTKFKTNTGCTLTLTSIGWELIDELEKESKAINQGFIAMCFDKELNDARIAIKNAINKCGYIPLLIDEKQYNGQIVPEIFYEIRNSKFIIADLTKDRRGVYYEAGYGEALGKEVVLTCRETDFKDIHFDVAQKSIIKWENEEDLEKRLIDRITATVGKIE